jgi:hypothetical protein
MDFLLIILASFPLLALRRPEISGSNAASSRGHAPLNS